MESAPISGSPIRLSEVFDEVFPYYLACGMTYDQFWHEDPCLAVYYREKKELEDRWANERAWLDGYYTNIAVSVAVSNKFRNKGEPPVFYPKQPLQFTEPTKAEAEAKQRKAMEESIDFVKRLDRRRVLNAGTGQPTDQSNG